MKMDNGIVKILGLIVLFGILVVVGLFITQFVWLWVIPDIFVGMVKEGLLPASITLWQAFKLDILIATLIGVSRG